jgi:uncharacterized protein YhhL (DUF1145 family)
MSVAKMVVLAAWAYGLISLFVAPGSAVTDWGRRIFWVLLIAHAIECVIFLPMMRKLPGSLGYHLGQTMLYGIVHLRAARTASQP